MKKAFASLFFVLLGLASTSPATAPEPPIRQAKLTVKIDKLVFTPHQDRLPTFETTPVCTQQALVNVYKDSSSLTIDDLALVQCESIWLQNKVTVKVGGAIYTNQNPNSKLPMKSTTLLLGWDPPATAAPSKGPKAVSVDPLWRYMENPKVSNASSTDPWLHFSAALMPIATGKIVNNTILPPDPPEIFSATVSIEDETR